MMPSGAGERGNARRAIRPNQLVHPGRNGGIGLVPADSLPLPAASGADSLLGIEKPLGVIHLLNDAHALDAAPAVVQRAIFRRPGLDHFSVFHGDIV